MTIVALRLEFGIRPRNCDALPRTIMVPMNAASLKFHILLLAFGQRLRRGRSTVEYRGNLYICMSVRMYAHMTIHPPHKLIPLRSWPYRYPLYSTGFCPTWRPLPCSHYSNHHKMPERGMGTNDHLNWFMLFMFLVVFFFCFVLSIFLGFFIFYFLFFYVL